MSTLMQAIQGELGGESLSALSGALGTDKSSTQKAIAAALPALIAGLSQNAKKPGGAEKINAALKRDHSQPFQQLGGLGGLAQLMGAMTGGDSKEQGGMGAIMGLAAGLLSSQGQAEEQPKGLDGAGILRHVLGGKKPQVEEGVAKASGLNPSTAAKLLPMLAPLVMSALGTVRQEKDLDSEGVAHLLEEETQEIKKEAPAASGIMGLLDRDGDGSCMGELMELGGQLKMFQGLFD